MMFGTQNIFKLSYSKATFILLLFLPLFFLLPTNIYAAEVVATWDGGASGTWGTASNWNPDVVPNNGVDTYEVRIADADVTLNIDATVREFILGYSTGNGTLNLNNATNLSIVGNSFLSNEFINNDTISLNATTGTSTGLFVITDDVNVIGSGTIVAGGTGAGNEISGTSGLRWINVGNTINVPTNTSLNIGRNLISFTLQSTAFIDANGGTLTIDPINSDPNGFDNNGTVQVSSGGLIKLLTGTYDNQTGTFKAVDGVIQLTGATVEGGAIDISGTGAVDVTAPSTLDTGGATMTVTGAGNITLNGATALTITGGGVLTNNAQLDTVASGSLTSLLFSADTTVNGTGGIILANNSRISGTSGVRVTLGSGQTVTMDGASESVGLNLLKITNQGLIKAIKTGTIGSIDPVAGADGVINSGTLRAEDFGTLALQPGIYNNGATGVIDASSLVTYNGIELEGGSLIGAGTHRFVTSVSTLDGGTNAITIASGARVEQNNGVGLVAIGTITVNGEFFSLGGGGFLTDFAIGANNVTLNGTGSYHMSSVGASSNSRFTGTGGGTLTVASGLTIDGHGNVMANTGNVINNGLFHANVLGEIMTFDPLGSITNNGILRASGGGIITLAAGSYDGTGTTEVLTGSTLNVNGGATLTGGTYSTSGTGEIRFVTNTPTINGITIASGSTLIQEGDTNINIQGTITNNGAINMDVGSFTLSQTLNAGDVTLTGTGKTVLGYGAGPAQSQIIGSGATRLLTLGSSYTVEGNGIIGNASLNLDNDGLVNASTSGKTLTLNTASTIVGDGTFRASSGGRLLISDAITGTSTSSLVVDSGATAEWGAINVSVGSATIDGLLKITGGTLTTIGNLTVGGEMQLASGLSVGGNFSFSLTDETLWDLDGPTAFLTMTGGVGQSQPANIPTLEIGGSDFGDDPFPGTVTPDVAGFVSNFDITTLTIGTNARVQLVDSINNGNRNGEFAAAEALYVDTLTLEAGSKLYTNGLNLYYNTVNLIGGGVIEDYITNNNTFAAINDSSPGNIALDLLEGTADPTILWDSLTGDGLTTMVLETTLPSLSGYGFVYNGSNAVYYDITTTAPFTGSFTVTFNLDGLTGFGSPNDIFGIHDGTIVFGTYNSGNNTYSFTANSFSDFGLGTTPEPSTLFLMLSGLLGLYRLKRRFF